ncbi:MAG: class I adenylate-forming enzyme family protein [Alphaproteobacteria bacterium]
MTTATGAGSALTISIDANLADGVLAHARTDRDRPALIVPAGAVTYGALATRIARFADGLRREGIAPGERIALTVSDTPSAAIGFFGAALAGIATVPIAPDMPAAEREALVGELAIVATLGGVDDDAPLRVPRLLARGRTDDPAAMRAPGGAREATVMLSSGTTGRPKAIALSHHRQLWFLRAFAAALGTSPGDRYLPVVAPSFAFGRNPMLRLLDAGGTVIARKIPADVDGLVDLVRASAATELVLTPSHVHHLLAAWTGAGPAFPDLRRMIVSTAFLHHAARLQAMRRISPALHVGLGTNEVGYVALSGPDDLVRVPDTVGRALPEITIEVVDESGAPMAPGAIGELRIAGPNVGSGYLNAPEASRSAFRAGWFHPGDLATLDAGGFLHLVGRVDDRINQGGIKIYPVEIERVLRAHPAVAEAAAVGLPAVRSGEMVAAAVVLSGSVTIDELDRWSRERLGAVKSPRRILAVDALPRNAMGKVPPAELRALLLDILSRT